MATVVEDVRGLLFAQAPDGIIFADREGLIRDWNTAAERIFGFSAADVVGRSLDLVIPESLRAAHWRGYERAIAAGETKYGGRALPTKALRGDGETIYVELSFAIVHGRDGEVIGALAHARDITERWIAEREQRRRLRALEQAEQAADQPAEPGTSTPVAAGPR